MLHSREILFMTVAFLVPHSKALITDNIEETGDTAGYLCKTLGNVTKVNINYLEENEWSSCQVTLEKNGNEAIPLLNSTRNKATCENKAEMMKQRLTDRGWQCLASGQLH